LVACGLVEEPDVERLLGFAGGKGPRRQKLMPLSRRQGTNARHQKLLGRICRFVAERCRVAKRMPHGSTSISVAMANADVPNASRKSAAFEALLAARKMARLSSRSTFSHDPR